MNTLQLASSSAEQLGLGQLQGGRISKRRRKQRTHAGSHAILVGLRGGDAGKRSHDGSAWLKLPASFWLPIFSAESGFCMGVCMRVSRAIRHEYGRFGLEQTTEAVSMARR
jgi:hypothetical protein